MFSRLREAQPVTNLETVRLRKDGTEIQVALSVSPIKDAQGQVIGGTAIARDITEQKRAARGAAQQRGAAAAGGGERHANTRSSPPTWSAASPSGTAARNACSATPRARCWASRPTSSSPTKTAPPARPSTR